MQDCIFELFIPFVVGFPSEKNHGDSKIANLKAVFLNVLYEGSCERNFPGLGLLPRRRVN